MLKRRQAQRVRIARSIKDVRAYVPKGRNRHDALISLQQIADNYPKYRGAGLDRPSAEAREPRSKGAKEGIC